MRKLPLILFQGGRLAIYFVPVIRADNHPPRIEYSPDVAQSLYPQSEHSRCQCLAWVSDMLALALPFRAPRRSTSSSSQRRAFTVAHDLAQSPGGCRGISGSWTSRCRSAGSLGVWVLVLFRCLTAFVLIFYLPRAGSTQSHPRYPAAYSRRASSGISQRDDRRCLWSFFWRADCKTKGIASIAPGTKCPRLRPNRTR